MFRPMRRFKQQLSEVDTIKIVAEGKSAVLSVLGDDGYPYSVPINYVYANNKIYIHGAKTGHKYDAIKNCDKVSLCIIGKDDIVPEKLTTYFRSVIIFGRAKILETEAEIFKAAEVLGLKYYQDKIAVDEEIKHEWNILSCIEITIEHMTGKEAVELMRARK